VCDSLSHSNCLQTGVTETNACASTGKSAYKRDGCKRLTEEGEGDTANEHSIAKSKQKEALSSETESTASRSGDNDSLSLQLEAVHVNGIRTIEMVKLLQWFLSLAARCNT
jgi:hypothetical protein